MQLYWHIFHISYLKVTENRRIDKLYSTEFRKMKAFKDFHLSNIQWRLKFKVMSIRCLINPLYLVEYKVCTVLGSDVSYYAYIVGMLLLSDIYTKFNYRILNIQGVMKRCRGSVDWSNETGEAHHIITIYSATVPRSFDLLIQNLTIL